MCLYDDVRAVVMESCTVESINFIDSEMYHDGASRQAVYSTFCSAQQTTEKRLQQKIWLLETRDVLHPPSLSAHLNTPRIPPYPTPIRDAETAMGTGYREEKSQ
ncbi:hypothetical protein EKO27_g11884 [Xylaria grammica]|uniref:Uncharacterized protein n=1 Tax=Xylaria grammica TaxID=363999 RepID=A0A439CM32_9PEZI|nr:hypothetical protein EKO27_g11884 [Xylaria grammica]